ncbi:MAG: NFACT family protein [Candidatus Gastranaerophilales bacterium]|nr:NFACT family protein [Candidatus Gastranaerophilales bacterium]
MINFDSLTLKALMNEIKPIIENSRVQKIRQPSRRELVLTLRNNSKNHTLFISIKPSFAHLCLLEDEFKNFRIMDIPQSPPMFCMLLRKYLENSKIEKVVTPEHERIVEFYFTAYGELGERINLVLAIELMGKHSNMILYNADTKIIVGCAHNVGEEKSKTRELAGSLPYVYPPKYYKKDILEITEEEFLSLSKVINTTIPNWLNETFYDISVPLAKEICGKYNIPTKKDFGFVLDHNILKNIFNDLKEILSLKNPVPSISADFEEFSLTGIYSNHLSTVNMMVDLYFGQNSYFEIIERKRKSLNSVVDRELKKVKRLIKKLSLGEEQLEKINLYKEIAYTLIANIYLRNIHEDKITLKNVYTSDDIEIEIDKTISLNDNAQNYYKLYAKAKKTKETNEELFLKYQEKENYLKSINSTINLAVDLETLNEIEEETSSLNPLNQNKEQNEKTKKTIVEKIELDNFQIFIGKNNKQNDYIVSKLSSPEDYWFHVQGDFGSHVLVKCKSKNDFLPDEILLQASKLAAKYSERRNDAKINIIYTKRKYLRKPPKANLGYVTYKNEKEITVELDN